MPRYLKSPLVEANRSEEVTRTVSEMLKEIESGREAAVRRYSEKLDGWNPESLEVNRQTIDEAATKVNDDLKEHIDLAQGQIRAFAGEQRKTLSELEFEAGPGIIIGHKLVPVETVGAYVPGGQLTFMAS